MKKKCNCGVCKQCQAFWKKQRVSHEAHAFLVEKKIYKKIFKGKIPVEKVLEALSK